MRWTNITIGLAILLQSGLCQPVAQETPVLPETFTSMLLMWPIAGGTFLTSATVTVNSNKCEDESRPDDIARVFTVTPALLFQDDGVSKCQKVVGDMIADHSRSINVDCTQFNSTMRTSCDSVATDSDKFRSIAVDSSGPKKLDCSLWTGPNCRNIPTMARARQLGPGSCQGVNYQFQSFSCVSLRRCALVIASVVLLILSLQYVRENWE